MTKLQTYIEDKKDTERELSNLFGSYYEKYMRRLYKPYHELKNRERLFQKALLKIAKWNEEEKKRDYKQFIRWASQKCDVSESKISDWLNVYVESSINILTFPDYTNYEFEKDIPSVKSFYHDGLRKVSRYYYNNPSLMSSGFEDKTETEYIKDLVSTFLTKFVPFDQIAKKIEEEDLSSYEHPMSSDFDEERLTNVKQRLSISEVYPNYESTINDRVTKDHGINVSVRQQHEYYDADSDIEGVNETVGDGESPIGSAVHTRQSSESETADGSNDVRHIVWKKHNSNVNANMNANLNKSEYDRLKGKDDFFTE